VDGGSTWTPGATNSQISNVGIDFIEEVSIKTANFSADTPQLRRQHHVVTRSGSNDFRGSAYEYHRNDGRTGTTFQQRPRVDKARLRYNDFASLGGPIQKKSCSSSRARSGRRSVRFTTPPCARCPRERWRQGDFSALATPIRDPLTGSRSPATSSPPAG